VLRKMTEIYVFQGDLGIPGAPAPKGEKGEKGRRGKRGYKVSSTYSQQQISLSRNICIYIAQEKIILYKLLKL
jgi:hypothetical protein